MQTATIFNIDGDEIVFEYQIVDGAYLTLSKSFGSYESMSEHIINNTIDTTHSDIIRYEPCSEEECYFDYN